MAVFSNAEFAPAHRNPLSKPGPFDVAHDLSSNMSSRTRDLVHERLDEGCRRLSVAIPALFELAYPLYKPP
jgi:hypothetical protein